MSTVDGMPELPEVESIRRGLHTWISGRTVTGVEVRHPRAVRRHLAGADDFAARLTGTTVTGTHRRGKYLWLQLDSGDTLLCHLGMSGQLLISSPQDLDGPHLRIRFTWTGATTSYGSSINAPSVKCSSVRTATTAPNTSRTSRPTCSIHASMSKSSRWPCVCAEANSNAHSWTRR